MDLTSQLKLAVQLAQDLINLESGGTTTVTVPPLTEVIDAGPLGKISVSVPSVALSVQKVA